MIDLHMADDEMINIPWKLHIAEQSIMGLNLPFQTFLSPSRTLSEEFNVSTGRLSHPKSAQVIGFTRPFESGAPQIDSTNFDWRDCSNKKPMAPVHPICCGPSMLSKIFDARIHMLEEEIVEYCCKIKEKTTTLRNCCRQKELLVCRKNTLHNILMVKLEKMKKLQIHLFKIRFAVCCPKVSAICMVDMDVREEIENIRRLEDKVEALYNGKEYKRQLESVCKADKEKLEKFQKDWEADLQLVEKAYTELSDKLNKMKEICKPSEQKDTKWTMSPVVSQIKGEKEEKEEAPAGEEPNNPPPVDTVFRRNLPHKPRAISESCDSSSHIRHRARRVEPNEQKCKEVSNKRQIRQNNRRPENVKQDTQPRRQVKQPTSSKDYTLASSSE